MLLGVLSIFDMSGVVAKTSRYLVATRDLENHENNSFEVKQWILWDFFYKWCKTN